MVGRSGSRSYNGHSSTSNGTGIDQWTCESGHSNEAWTYEPASGHLVNAYSGKCLNDAGYGGQGADVIQWTCGNYANEDWAHTSAGQYKLAYNGLCLNDPDYSRFNGTQQIVWACVNTSNEKYSLPG